MLQLMKSLHSKTSVTSIWSLYSISSATTLLSSSSWSSMSSEGLSTPPFLTFWHWHVSHLLILTSNCHHYSSCKRQVAFYYILPHNFQDLPAGTMTFHFTLNLPFDGFVIQIAGPSLTPFLTISHLLMLTSNCHHFDPIDWQWQVAFYYFCLSIFQDFPAGKQGHVSFCCHQLWDEVANNPTRH